MGDVWRLHNVWRLTVSDKTGRRVVGCNEDASVEAAKAIQDVDESVSAQKDVNAETSVNEGDGGMRKKGEDSGDGKEEHPPCSRHVPGNETAKSRRDSDESVEIPELLQPDYFMYHPNGDRIDFFKDYLRPFMVRYICRLRDVLPRAILFAEGDGFGEQNFVWLGVDPEQTVNTSHWYDGFTLFKRSYNPRFTIDVKRKMPVFGRGAVKALHRRDLSFIVNLPKDEEGNRVVMPTLLGEFGIPYDMNARIGYRRGKFKPHVSALSMYYDIFDELQIHSTQWNYCPDNSNAWGDNWNREDLSIFSRDQQFLDSSVSLDSGGRAPHGLLPTIRSQDLRSAHQNAVQTQNGQFFL